VLCVFVFWQREKPIETGNVGSVYTIYVVAHEMVSQAIQNC